MKNHFIFSYAGNKRGEVEEICKNLDLEGIDTIVEPYGGSLAFSFYLSTLYPKKFKYIVNDNAKFLFDLYNILCSEDKTKKINDELNKLCFTEDGAFIDKQTYSNIKKDKTLVSYLMENSYYSMKQGMYPMKKIIPKNFNSAPICNFFRNENVTMLNGDGLELFKQYENSKNCLLFIDPPYMICNNSFYNNPSFNIYQYLAENDLNQKDAYIALCLENNFIIKSLFKQYNVFEYDKVYQVTKKQTKHCLITNDK